jgi:ribosomal protein S7
MAEWFKALVLKTSVYYYTMGSNPILFNMLRNPKSILYINKFCQMLIMKGKKALTQNSFKKLLFFYAKKGNKNTTLLFKKCFYNLFPYLALKVKKHKRGKRVSYKTKFLEEAKAEKKALLSFSKFMKESSKKSISFVIRLGQEFKSLANNKKHTLRFKRDNLHKIALKNAKKP